MHTLRRLFLVAVWAVLISGQLPAQPPIDVKQQERVVLKIHAIGASGMAGTDQPPHVIEVDPDQGGSLSFELPWPDSRSPSNLTLSVVELPTAAERQHSLSIDANLRLADGTEGKATLEMMFSEPSTTLFEVYRIAGKSLTLVIEFDTVQHTEMKRYPEITAPVLFLLEVQRVIADRVISLETNRMQSFIDQSVTYSFKLGETDEAAAIRLQLTPVRISGTLLELEIEISGTMPGDEAIAVAGRGERLIVSRNTPSTIAFERGDPSDGYRFIVTAAF
jgi:hypothetical protein